MIVVALPIHVVRLECRMYSETSMYEIIKQFKSI